LKTAAQAGQGAAFLRHSCAGKKANLTTTPGLNMGHILKHSKSVRYSQVLNDPLPASARRIVMKILYAFSFSFIFTFSSTASTMKRKNSEEVDIIIIMALTRFFRKDLFQGNDNRKGQRFLKRMKTSAHPSHIHQRATPYFGVSFH
jgi:hypothetical protein